MAKKDGGIVAPSRETDRLTQGFTPPLVYDWRSEIGKGEEFYCNAFFPPLMISKEKPALLKTADKRTGHEANRLTATTTVPF